ncbi:probable serine/threonine-protein kinase PBL16 [Syzygium oleosum]|uniref:probable serine/threonine-protein kinase PBL16 n=1 Tax=Syzygium oleosum TaxID=219896 RepID=UPI0024BAB13C|nr:probable serine/threonine-protein kinase PBL16 [Syzygium oleosum]
MRGSSATANRWLERDGVAAAECAEILRRDERCNSYGWAEEEAMKTKIGGSARRRSAEAVAVAPLRAAMPSFCGKLPFAVFIVQTDLRSIINVDVALAVGWSANRNHPVGSQAILELTVGEDLVLKDADGFVAWSTQTYAKSVAGIKLTNTGNLVLFDENNTAVWESFNDPKDTLLPGQKLRYLKFKSEGHLSVYQLHQNGWSITRDTLTDFLGRCGYPMVCGHYGICHADGQCRCPDGFFKPIDSLNPQFGCSEVIPLSCEDSHFQSFWRCPFRTKGVHEVEEEKGVYEAEEDYLDQIPGAPRRFNYDDLKAIIEDFNKRLGEGGFGSVYQGTLSNGAKVTAKHPKGLSQTKKSFLAEVEIIGNIQHLNLVQFVGFCGEKFHRLLVYKYMSKKSLGKWIFHKSDELCLIGNKGGRSFVTYHRVCYLHAQCIRKIVHMDIKPQNILLDDKFNAKAADFGLSKLIDGDQTQIVATMWGTQGYLAPEWLHASITEKVDVYSFSVVILEIVCGRKIVKESQNQEDMYLLEVFLREKAKKDNCRI